MLWNTGIATEGKEDTGGAAKDKEGRILTEVNEGNEGRKLICVECKLCKFFATQEFPHFTIIRK